VRTLALLILVAAPAFATVPAPLPRTVVEDSPAFDSVAEAVLAVYATVTQPFPRVEVGGAIVARGGKFFYTTPVTTAEAMGLGFRIGLRRGETLVAWYHTHGADPRWGAYERGEIEWISRNDVEISIRLGVPAYVAIEPTRNVRVFDPAVDMRRVTSTGRVVGREVGLLPVAVASSH
jgi:Domain of unknown function (DUF4329)